MKIFKKYICVRQHDSSDCGAACLATVAKEYGADIRISKIRKFAGTDKGGTTVLGLIKAGEKLNLKSKAVRLKNYDDIKKNFPKPAIAHVTKNRLQHYVVIHEVRKDTVVIADPARGIVKCSLKEFFDIWKGILITFVPTKEFKPQKSDNIVIKGYLQLIKTQKKFFISIFMASLFTTLLGLVGTFYYKFIVDNVANGKSRNGLLLISLGVIALLVFKAITEFMRSVLVLKVTQNLDKSILMGFYKHVIRLPMNFYRTRGVGEIVSRFNDATKIRDMISSVTITVMIDSIMVIGGTIILYSFNKELFFISFIPLVAYLLIIIFFKNPLENGNHKLMESNARFYSYLVESLEGMEMVKAVNGENTATEESEGRFSKVLENMLKFGYINNLQSSIKDSISPIFTVIVLWVGVVEVLSKQITIGTLISYSALLTYFIGPIERLTGLQSQIQSAMVASDRLFEVLEVGEEKVANESTTITSLLGEIKFKNVDFRYGIKKKILNNLNFEIKAGEKVGFVGESGSGKTTIAKLLMGFYDIENGEISINSYNLKNIDKQILRDKVAYVSQESFFFSGTIRENFEFVKPGVEFDEIVKVCKIVRMDDYIDSLPYKYGTMLQENASNLSAGQRQRLSIAKAILRNPEILIMDEATSNLDSITEIEIEKELETYNINNTRIIIAHRLCNVVKCDKIFVFKNGEIIEHGTHEELLSFRGYYFELWCRQAMISSQDVKVIS
ncbi:MULTISPECIES: peptidase domain-containing ABC transporter [Clostridium]|uniref:peptidase domain-containing ABC transporter n=1 Tax=Clostridium TaxID=1485 RepID=UPI0008265ED9|nr:MULTISPECIES: peptidase domain-containing ABC transporter [Clostridium]PJI07956.1 peptide cleavage/export ABC transporter [Clostridium sp. CT7]